MEAAQRAVGEGEGANEEGYIEPTEPAAVVWSRAGVNKPSVEHFSLAGRNTVVRCDNLPPAVDVHPDIGQAVVIFVGLTFGDTFFVIRTSDDSRTSILALAPYWR
jgi:hypothetical protein